MVATEYEIYFPVGPSACLKGVIGMCHSAQVSLVVSKVRWQFLSFKLLKVEEHWLKVIHGLFFTTQLWH